MQARVKIQTGSANAPGVRWNLRTHQHNVQQFPHLNAQTIFIGYLLTIVPYIPISAPRASNSSSSVLGAGAAT